ncbi:MAG: tetratricopeptide repeat protein [Candidatus Izemoplasmatales bacterium]
MKKKEFYTTIIVFAVISTALIITNFIFEYLDWLLLFAIILVGYMYFRYRLTTPMQKFSNKFNMLMDYDLNMEGAIDLAQEHIEEAPTRAMKALFQVHLGMAYYNNGQYERAIETFNNIELNKLNTVYHVLIFAHQAYAHYELGNEDQFELALERIKNVKPKIHRKFIGYANSYERLLTAIKNIEEDPEDYRAVIEANLSQHHGFISQRLVYHYRMAHYYKVIGDTKKMDIELAKVLANGKGHFTAKEAEDMFQKSVDVDDYIFTEDDFEAEVEPKEEEKSPKEQLEESKELDVFDVTPDNLENKDSK